MQTHTLCVKYVYTYTHLETIYKVTMHFFLLYGLKRCKNTCLQVYTLIAHTVNVINVYTLCTHVCINSITRVYTYRALNFYPPIVFSKYYVILFPPEYVCLAKVKYFIFFAGTKQILKNYTNAQTACLSNRQCRKSCLRVTGGGGPGR